MNKAQFMNKLKSSLSKIHESDRDEIIQDFEEHFTFGLAEGKTEEEIAKALGSPQNISKEIMATYRLDQVTTKVTTGNIFRAIWAVIGLGFFNLIIVLAPFVAIAGFTLSGWITGAAFIIAPLLMIGNVIIDIEAFSFFDLFSSIGLCGFGILLVIAMYYATKFLTKAFIRYLHFNVRLVKGGMQRD